MADGFIVRKGGVAEEVLRTAVPSINFISATATSLTFTFKNNEDAQVDLYYGVTTPPTTKITLAANATSSNQTITGLDDTQNFDVYAYAIVTEPLSKKIKSEIVETQAQTLIPTPTITQVSKTDTSITFTVRNNSRVAADVLYDLITPPVETTLQLAANTTSANQTISGLTASTSFTVFAQAKVAGFADSTIASSAITTNAPPIVFTAATGGTTLEYNSGGKRFRSHTFNSSGTFTVTTAGNSNRNQVDYLIIAGGGGGAGSDVGAGGGAGGYRTTLGTSGANSAAESKVTVTAQSNTITVGSGGTAGGGNSNGGSGVNSSALGITSTGGGFGSFLNNTPGNGGSGGGGGGSSTTNGGSGTANQGRNGGNGAASGIAPAGGGGASAIGGNGTTSASGNGGNGLPNTLRTGSSETRAGGGGGGAFNPSYSSGSGGSGGGGNGGGDSVGTAGAINTGSGGGGGGTNSSPLVNNVGLAGGSGIVVIRYEIATV